jgi:DNA-directed RNA polymerase subunit M/transcription elongation factor TFIIS
MVACTMVCARPGKEAVLMHQLVNPARRCPECGSQKYAFRGRKKIAAEEGQPAAVETKYRCKACGKEWKERVPVKEAG